MNFAGVKSITIPEGDVKSIAIGGVTVWTKPNPLPYDSEVQFVESTGTQYVDTGLMPDDNLVIDGIFAISQTQGGGAIIGSGSTHSSSDRMQIYIQDVSLSVRFDGGIGTYGNLTIGTWYGIVANIPGKSYSVNGSSVSVGQSGSVASGVKMTVFARNTLTGVGNFAYAKIKHMRIFSSGVLVRDYVPVRVGQTGYLFDRSSGQLFGNAGTGSFVLGPDTFAQGVVPTRMMAMGIDKNGG